jgi:hypothetical protein
MVSDATKDQVVDEIRLLRHTVAELRGVLEKAMAEHVGVCTMLGMDPDCSNVAVILAVAKLVETVKAQPGLEAQP